MTPGGCRACERGSKRQSAYQPNLMDPQQVKATHYPMPRQESRMLASKMRQSVLKQLESAGKSTSPSSPATPLECFNYNNIEIPEGEELTKALGKLSLEDLENIVMQESKDISCALTMAGKNNVNVDVQLRHEETNPNCRQKTGDILSRICDLEEDMTAETVAKMMYAAEIKSALTAPPQVIYNLLFDDSDYEPLPLNTVGTDTPLNDVVVPLGAPSNFRTDPDLEDAARMSARQQPDDDASDSEDTLHTQLMDQVLENAKSKPETLEELLLGVNTQRDESYAALSDFNLLLEPNAPAYQTHFQLRGSGPPSWFPDYFVLFPDSPFKKFERITNPMAALERAWESVQPSELNPSEGIHMIGL